jgi:dipeptidyl aminopeptidase/acylaminoacyl peptidase
MRVLALAALTAGLLMADFAVATSQPVPLEDFIRRPSYSGVRISPTGEYLALTADRGEQDVLVVLRTKDLSPVKVNQLPDDKSVGQFAWVGPNRLMFGATTKSGSLEAPRSTGEWFAVNADGSDPRPIIFYGTRTAAERSKAVGAQSFSLLDPLVQDDSKVLMAAYYPRGRESSGVEVVEVDTFAGRRKVLAKAPRGNCGIALDETKQPRFAVCTDAEDAEGNFDTQTELYRRDEGGKWTLLNRSKDGGQRLEVVRTAKDGRVYAMRGDGKAPSAFGVLDPQTGAFTELFHDKVSDVAYNIMATDNETIIGVVTMAGKPNISLVEESHPDAELYASLAAAFPGQFVNFSSATGDGKQIVVSVYSDRNPGQLYLYDRDSGKARFLMQARSWIDPEKMATMKPFSFVNRDGMRIYGYLTIPAGSDGKNLPMVVNPHGGPMGPRDVWGFNNETQMFASRGYMTLQVNFRGSGGFGKAFEDMAYGQWATGIMHDIIDATRWAIEQGHADKDRICIYGGSFGGYSSMMAPVVAPDLYKCAFGYVGNYSAAIQLKLSDTSKSEYGRRYQMRAYGATEAEQTAMSPITHASKLKLPIYLAAGARDPRCPPENTTAMFKALKEAGNEPEGMIIASGEMHGFYKEENNLKLYTEMLAFFDRHIGGKSEAVAQQ